MESPSCYKELSTMLSSGSTFCPPIVTLYIWAGWVLGGVKDKYLFREKSSDHYAGLCTSCLDQLKKEFAVSPPYLDFTKLCEIEKLDRNRKIRQILDTRLPRYTSISDETIMSKCAALQQFVSIMKS